MIAVENIRSLTDFRKHTKDYVEKLSQTDAPLVLTVNGEAAIVVQNAKAFQEIQNRLRQLEEELNHFKLMALRHDIQAGVDQIEAGEYTAYTDQTSPELIERIKAKGRAQKGTP